METKKETTADKGQSHYQREERKEELTAEDLEYLKPNWDESVEKFDDLGLKEEVLRGIFGYGFVKPSPIQQKGILPVI